MERIGVFFCSGCGIGPAGGLDGCGLEDEAGRTFGARVCLWHERLCSADGVALIKRTVADEELEGVAIAACSGRHKRTELDIGLGVAVERIDLRELCLWITAPEARAGEEPTDLHRLALDSLRMGLTRLRKTKAGEPYLLETTSRTVLVLGGGVAGMSAALGVARAGYHAVLVEREERLGGLVAQLHRQFPHEPPHAELIANTVPALIGELESTGGLTVRTSTEVKRIAGGPGLFEVHLSRAGGGGDVVERAGAIVLATGASPYDASGLGHLGYGRSLRVVTSLELERLAAGGGGTGAELASLGRVAFIQCAGSRDEAHLPYCSSHCCSTTLKQALYVREQNPESKVYIFYKDIRTPGRAEDFYRRVQDDEGVFLARGEVTRVEPTGEAVTVEVTGSSLGERIEVEVDLVVLATGLVPSTRTGDRAFDDAAARGSSPEAAARPPARALRLDYRQGPELPNLEHGFPDSHFICFPYETRRTGIFGAGTVRAPMDSQRAADDGLGAALKAIQCIEATARGAALHPRSGDTSFPEFNLARCTQCKRCTEECPYGALNEDDRSNPLPHPTRCRRCGTCMGACPERIISFRDFSVDMIGSMIKAIDVPDEFEEKPRVLVLACENDAYPALELAAAGRRTISPWVRVIPLRCLGSLHLVWIADALARGIDGILLLGCRYGDDSQCHNHDGSKLCADRLSKVAETLERLALAPERVRMEQVQMSDAERLPELIDGFVRAVVELEPNPYKGM